MKSNLVYILFFFSFAFSISAQNDSSNFAQNEKIVFQAISFEEALQKAKKENKFIFIDVYTDWCKPCKEMDKYVFTDSLVANFYTANFINIKINGESETAKEFVEKYKVNGYPSLFFLDTNATMLYHFEGYMNIPLLYNVGIQVLKVDNIGEKAIQLQEEIFKDISKKYSDYPCEIENIKSYLNSISEEKLEIEFSQITRKYTTCIEENNLYTKEYLLFLLENFISTKNDSAYSFYENHRTEFEKNYGDSLIVLESDIFFYSFFENTDKIQQDINARKKIEKEDIDKFENEVKIILSFAEKLEKKGKEKGFQTTPISRFHNVILNISTRFYGRNKNKEMYYKYITTYYQPSYLQDYINHKEIFSNPVGAMEKVMSFYLENFYSNQDDIEKLVIIWNYVLENNYINTSLQYFTAAKIFYYNKEKQKAKNMLQKAFELREENFDELKYKELQNQINQL